MGIESFFFPCPKRITFKSKAYLRWVIRDGVCCACGQEKTEYVDIIAHHFHSKGSGGHDHQTVPLCVVPCHTEVHIIGKESFELKYGIDFVSIQTTLLEKFLEETNVFWEKKI